MKTVLQILMCYALIPFAACIAGFFLNFLGTFWMNVNIAVIPALIAGIYILFRNKLNMVLAAKANGMIFLVLFLVFTGMMIAADGNAEGQLMSSFMFFILPYFPVMLVMALMGKYMLLYVCALLGYFAAFVTASCLAKINIKKVIAPLLAAAVCVPADTFLYLNRPAVRYGGHGFEYMNGFSSTDFTDYTVYAENSKLAVLDHEPSFVIENADEMPVLDGAEACYPLYAAVAKAVYKDIDRIEQSVTDSDSLHYNGRIVSFTNTILGFNRLVMGGEDPDKYGSVDMFFGARPSASQMEMAKEFGVELDITPIGKEAFVFFVEEDNPVDNLTKEQLKAIYHGDITNWSELGGRNEEIAAFQRPANSGSQTMMEYFMGDVSLKKPQTYETVDAMTGVIKQVAQYTNEKGAIGYSFRYFLEGLNQEKGVKMLSVDGVYPTLENIENGSYPLTVDLCLVTRTNDPNPNVRKMIDFILSEDGQTLVRETGYGGLEGVSGN